jgi:hypothetical protein
MTGFPYRALLFSSTNPSGPPVGEHVVCVVGLQEAVAVAPELVKSSEWIPFSFADEEQGVKDVQVAMLERLAEARMVVAPSLGERVTYRSPASPFTLHSSDPWISFTSP